MKRNGRNSWRAAPLSRRGTANGPGCATAICRSGADRGPGAQGARPLRIGHHVQLNHRAAVYPEIDARVGGAAWLYLNGISTGDRGEALRVLLGDAARGLSANVVSRLKAQWADEPESWNRRDLSRSRYVYWWADGIHTGLRSEHADGQCLLVMIGVTPDGRNERVAIGDGDRESKESWKELWLDLKRRGVHAGPWLAVGDGAMGFWAAMEEQ